jgi:ATP-dependent RNA helicase DDX5/DBP2
MQLYAVDFSAIKLVDFVKDFYVPTESVRRRSEEECEEIRRANDISIIGGENVPKVIVSFEESSFPEYVVRSLYRQFGPNARPTPIQMQGWPIALSGRSVVGIAQTGSGKTLAYILPAVVHINAQAPAEPREGPIALVLVPTRELCTQIAQEAEKFSQAVIDVGGIPTKIAVAFGGVKKNEQVWALRESLDVLVASPGRLMDFLNCGETSLHRTTYLVLDEADQMFDMGFEPQLRQILSQIRPDRQTLMWSATWPREVRNLAKSICVDQPVHIQIGSEELTANHQIHQVAELVTGEKEKMDKLFSLVLPQLYLTDAGERIEDAKMLIFCNTKDTVDYLTKKMREEGVNAVAIHSGKEQKERLWVFDQFRTGETKVLVATNLMGRGVDVPKVNIVLNYDMPKKIEEYIHRIGRTARAGAVGKAISFVSYGDSGVIPDLIGVMNEATQDVPDWLVQMHRNPYYRAI